MRSRPVTARHSSPGGTANCDGYRDTDWDVGLGGSEVAVSVGDAELHGLLVGVEAGEAGIVGYVQVELAELGAALLQPVREEVGQGDDLEVLRGQACVLGDVLGVIALLRVDDLRGGAQQVEHGTGTPAAAADDAHADRIVGRRATRDDVRKRLVRGDAGEGERGRLQKLAPREVGLRFHGEGALGERASPTPAGGRSRPSSASRAQPEARLSLHPPSGEVGG